jgi:hypothetical protein
MSSEVDICNLALSHLGDEASVSAITPPDGTAQAAHCKRFYPIARDMLLEMHPWTFATKRSALSEATNEAEDDWAYAYALPNLCIRPLSSYLPGTPARYFGNETTDAGSHPFIVEAAEDGSAILYTNVETATLRYIARVTDTSKFTSGFVVLLARLLAVYLAGPIIKGRDGMAVSKEQMRLFTAEFGMAASRDANSGKRNIYETYRPAHLAGRGLPALPDPQVTYP